MGLELINQLGPLKRPLLGHRLSLSMEQLRELFFSSPVSDSAYARIVTAPQLCKNTMCKSSFNPAQAVVLGG